MRRPSAALLVALLALFVALGGPAQAKRLIDGKDIRSGTVGGQQIKDRSIGARELSASALKTLQTTPERSIDTSKLALGSVTADRLGAGAVGSAAIADGTVAAVDVTDGAVTAGKLADGSVTGSKLADGSVTGAKVADGSLTSADIARFSGAFRIIAEDFGTIAPHECWTREPRGLAPEVAGADISQDALLVVPRASFSGRFLTFSYRTSSPSQGDPGAASRFVLTLCNRTEEPVSPPSIAFSYIVFDLI